MKNIIILGFLLLILVACKQNETPDTTPQTPEITSGQESNNQPELNERYDSSSVFHVASIPRFLVDSIKNDMNETRSAISIDMFGARIDVTESIKIQKILPKNYKKFQIPASAVDAYGGSANGISEYFYIYKKEGNTYYQIMHAKLEGENFEGDYPYTSIMTFSKPK